MKSPLHQLQGMTLAAVDELDGTVGLHFDGCTLRGFTKHRFSGRPSDLVGDVVASLSFTSGRELALHFQGGEAVFISLAPADYSGPEAFVATFGNGLVVVE